jgi:hypothetical protein
MQKIVASAKGFEYLFEIFVKENYNDESRLIKIFFV